MKWLTNVTNAFILFFWFNFHVFHKIDNTGICQILGAIIWWNKYFIIYEDTFEKRYLEMIAQLINWFSHPNPTPIEWQIHCQTNGLLSITFTTNKSGLLCLGSVSGCLAIFSAFYDFFTDRKTQSSHEQSQRRQKHSSSRQNDSPEVFFLLSY